jgi:hypothetical protein
MVQLGDVEGEGRDLRTGDARGVLFVLLVVLRVRSCGGRLLWEESMSEGGLSRGTGQCRIALGCRSRWLGAARC